MHPRKFGGTTIQYCMFDSGEPPDEVLGCLGEATMACLSFPFPASTIKPAPRCLWVPRELGGKNGVEFDLRTFTELLTPEFLLKPRNLETGVCSIYRAGDVRSRAIRRAKAPKERASTTATWCVRTSRGREEETGFPVAFPWDVVVDDREPTTKKRTRVGNAVVDRKQHNTAIGGCVTHNAPPLACFIHRVLLLFPSAAVRCYFCAQQQSTQQYIR